MTMVITASNLKLSNKVRNTQIHICHDLACGQCSVRSVNFFEGVCDEFADASGFVVKTVSLAAFRIGRLLSSTNTESTLEEQIYYQVM